ncbi:hypothetical protein B0I35DRAFT_147894 [Stachybotrys elegans]|uniref:Uncharacterized protein n=1 Tax=Stachybotrys elegans TaxID=80388 RepID=A0A8K0SG93_9HYPO|nr:hypothetical protein B0I35DRAFT_147894 [Stachybotrys elegans]
MPSDKDRLYIALYVRGGAPKMPGLEDTYHWGLLVGPKNPISASQVWCFHAKEKMMRVGEPPTVQSVWHYEEAKTTMEPASMILVRIVVAKVTNMNRLRAIFEQTPIRSAQQGWNCVAWVREALATAGQDGEALGQSVTDWTLIRDTAMQYVESKKANHRFDGKGVVDNTKVPTWDMLAGVELLP